MHFPHSDIFFPHFLYLVLKKVKNSIYLKTWGTCTNSWKSVDFFFIEIIFFLDGYIWLRPKIREIRNAPYHHRRQGLRVRIEPWLGCEGAIFTGEFNFLASIKKKIVSSFLWLSEVIFYQRKHVIYKLSSVEVILIAFVCWPNP